MRRTYLGYWASQMCQFLVKYSLKVHNRTEFMSVFMSVWFLSVYIVIQLYSYTVIPYIQLIGSLDSTLISLLYSISVYSHSTVCTVLYGNISYIAYKCLEGLCAQGRMKGG